MAEELYYYQTSGGGEITAIPLDQIPSFDTTRNTPITLNTAVNYDHPNWGETIDYAPRDLNGWTTVNFSTYDPNAWATTATPVKTYGWPDNNFTFRYPSESTRHADPKPEPVDTHELDEFIDSLKVIEGESEEYDND